MHFSIFDLYGGPAKKAVMVRQPYTYSKLPGVHKAPSSPDSVQWEDSSDTFQAQPALPSEPEAPKHRVDSTFHTFHPEVYLEHESVADTQQSLSRPMRHWSRSRRPSRNFTETYSYMANLKCMQHFSKQPDRALSRSFGRVGTNSFSHPRLSLTKFQQKRSLPLEPVSRNSQFPTPTPPVLRRHARHATEVGRKLTGGTAKMRNSLNLTYDAGKKGVALPRVGEIRVPLKKAGVRKTM